MISVIITAYNVQDFIQDAVRSVLRQTFKDVEIVVVCDKPTDETEILVDDIAEKDSRIRVVNYPLAKDSWASGFAEKRPFKRLALTSSPPV